ncbi:MAG TPA: LLM class F420-dependent oxidoreductase [Chloroflexota bacterium]|jgi:F420-dependent oxidoreductase-like protein|nr:LLM class F420-dependent oxidoreductase [Chloroflexota bacterium]
MQLGLQLPRFNWPEGPQAFAAGLARVARAADDAGYRSLWVMDHLFQIPSVGKPEEPMLESYSTLGFLAGITHRVRLGTMVTAVTYRSPGLLVKDVTTLDVLSGGRAILGIGAGWYEQEARGLDLPFPPLKERFERLEETLQIAQQMWRGDTTPFVGKHYRLEQPLNSPQVISTPHPPILIGGTGEKKTLPLVARYADACNMFSRMPKADMQRKLDLLRGYCQQEGRSYDSIEKTALVAFDPAEPTSQLVDEIGRLSELGFQTAILSLRDITRADAVQAVAESLQAQLASR